MRPWDMGYDLSDYRFLLACAAPPKKKVKVVRSAFESETFGENGSIKVKGKVGSAGISPSGRDACLASPDGLTIVDLDSPYSAPRRLRGPGKPWIVADAQWSPFAARDYWVASTANHQCFIWNLNQRDDGEMGGVQHMLQRHARAITGIHFAAHSADVVATCGVDGFVHCWDLRAPERPGLSVCDWKAGATQVKWNRQNAHVLASSHDGFLHVWDDRQPAAPVTSIEAHSCKIHGIDWSRTRSTAIVTCSMDKTIRFWDYAGNAATLERVICTDFSVWRARHTPFGNGLLAIPQTAPGRLYLFGGNGHGDEAAKPAVVFRGHGDGKTKEFLWRSRGGLGAREFQLVSWGEDKKLRLQTMRDEHLEAVGHELGGPAADQTVGTGRRARYRTFCIRDDKPSNSDSDEASVAGRRPDHVARGAGAGNKTGSGEAGTVRAEGLFGLPGRPAADQPSKGTCWAPSVAAGTATARFAGAGGGRPDQYNLDWMRGISMRETKTKRRARVRALHGGRNDAHRESFMDEFVRVSGRFADIDWDDIDLDALVWKASLAGPWGQDDDMVRFRIQVDVPTMYPRKAPSFWIEKTPAMADETHAKLSQEVHQLANRYIHGWQNCLFVTLRYLVGEVDAATALARAAGASPGPGSEAGDHGCGPKDDADDAAVFGEDSSSSDEEADGSDVAGGGEAVKAEQAGPVMRAEQTRADTGTAGNKTPRPRYSGARFGGIGSLVCFFGGAETRQATIARAKRKTEERQAAVDALKAAEQQAARGMLVRKRGAPGRGSNHDEAILGLLWGPGAAAARRGLSSSATSSSCSSEWGDDGSDSSEQGMADACKIRRGRRRKTPARDETATRTPFVWRSTGLGPAPRARNATLVYDWRSELPCKQELARDYAVAGDGATVCRHNAEVAARLGLEDRALVWRYAALLLRSRPSPHCLGSELVVAGEAGPGPAALPARVKWGGHPLARVFVNRLFDCYERCADVQMLAMLSCVLGAPTTVPWPSRGLVPADLAAGATHFTEYIARERLGIPLTPAAGVSGAGDLDEASMVLVEQPGLSTDDEGGDDGRQSDADDLEMAVQRRRDAQLVLSASDSNSGTPPMSVLGHLRHASQTCSLSSSPDNKQLPPIDSAGVTASLPRTPAAVFPQEFDKAVASPPPDPLKPRKRPGPADFFAVNRRRAAERDAGGELGDKLCAVQEKWAEVGAMVPVDVSCVEYNQSLIDDDDGWTTLSLLAPRRQHLYSQYRYAYSEMLHMWGFPLARLEMLKLDVLNEAAPSVRSAQPDALNPAARRRAHLEQLMLSGRGLDVVGRCHVHDLPLDPLDAVPADGSRAGRKGGAVGTCVRCWGHPPQTRLKCVLCLLPVAGLYVPCLGCGCVMHVACNEAWFAGGLETECPTGDECNCLRDAMRAQVESWAALRGAVNRF